MHLKGLLKVDDDEDDDAEADPALQQDIDNEKPFPGGVDAVGRTGGHVTVVAPDFGLRLSQGSRSGMVCGEILQRPSL
jgi:hypothetical protein